MNEKIAILQRWVNEAKRLVFFGGAGVSVESGIPDFRSPGGIYDTSQEKVCTNGTYSTEIVPLVHTKKEVAKAASFLAHPVGRWVIYSCTNINHCDLPFGVLGRRVCRPGLVCYA